MNYVDYDNKNYKVFYKDTKVAEFNSFKETTEYIVEQIKNDPTLDINDFYIYSKID